MTKIFKTPFGALGDKQEVPVSTQPDGAVSYEQGFGVDYQRDYEDPQAKDIPREKLNQLFYDMTKALGELQKLGYMQWQAGQYQAGDRVAEGGVAYKAIRATNKKPPHADWVSVLEGGEFVTADTDQAVGGVKTFTKFPVTPSAAPTANYQTANKKYVDDSAIGVGQTWQNMKGSRVAGTTYTNTTGRTIFANIDGNTASKVEVDGVVVILSTFHGSSVVIPADAEYILLSGQVDHWAELR